MLIVFGPVCPPSTKDSFIACRHYATNLSNLESGISLPQVSVISTMQTQALYAVLRDFDLADSRRGLSVDEAASLRAKLGCPSHSKELSASSSRRCFL